MRNGEREKRKIGELSTPVDGALPSARGGRALGSFSPPSLTTTFLKSAGKNREDGGEERTELAEPRVLGGFSSNTRRTMCQNGRKRTNVSCLFLSDWHGWSDAATNRALFSFSVSQHSPTSSDQDGNRYNLTGKLHTLQRVAIQSKKSFSHY